MTQFCGTVFSATPTSHNKESKGVLTLNALAIAGPMSLEPMLPP